jgi:D-xylose transport system ATP-binding protein
VRAGEVLGIGGLMGAGRSELLLHLFGAWGRRMAGRVALAGAPWAPAGPRQALDGGLALVVEDRKRQGLILDRGVGYNLSLASLGRLPGRIAIDRDAEAARNRAAADSLRIKAADHEVAVATLSGGNQQKVVIGKALLAEPRVVLLDEPTRGIDVGARAEVYAIINRLTDEGRAVVLVSSDLPELLGMSDRILMLADGRGGRVFARGEADQAALLAAAIPERNAP